MFKITSDNLQFRSRRRENYSSDDARRWSFFALVICEIPEISERTDHRASNFAEIKKELDEIGELDKKLDWFVNFFEDSVHEDDKSQLRHLYSLYGDMDSTEPKSGGIID